MPGPSTVPSTAKAGMSLQLFRPSPLTIAAAPTSGTSASLASQGTAAGALYSFKLLEALRSDDPAAVQPFLNELNQSGNEYNASKAGSLLGMAARISSAPLFAKILGSPNLKDPNVPIKAGSKATALHVASETGRADIVNILLSDPRVSDSIRDEQGRTPLESAATPEVSKVIEDSRQAMQLKYLARLTGYISSSLSSVEDSQNMVTLLESPRADLLNLSAVDERSGTTLLHEAARRRDLRLVELAVKRGADVYVRDRRGKRVLEGEKGADERVKVFLRQFDSQDNMLQSKSDGRPPDLKGFLSKWVNYKSGWRTRWFVLEQGVLSYYRNREDEPVACRGSIAMAVANLHPSHDGSRFEVGSRVSSAVPKFIVKSSHRAEITRWIQAIQLNVDYYSKTGRTASNASTQQKFTPPVRTATSGSLTNESSVGDSLSALPPTDTFVNGKLQRTTVGLAATPGMSDLPRSSSPANTDLGEDSAETLSIFEGLEGSDAGANPSPSHGIPHEGSYDVALLNIKAQVDLNQQLVSTLQGTPSGVVQGLGTDTERTSSKQDDVLNALRQSLSTLGTLISQHSIMAQDRERYLVNRIQREVEARRMWEENMLAVAEQQADMDRQLTEAAKDNEKKRKALRQARGVLAGLSSGSLPASPAAVSEPATMSSMLDSAPTSALSASSRPIFSARESISNIQDVQEVHDMIVAATAEDSDDGEGDEFFDAIETNALPNLKQHDAIANPDHDRPGSPVAEEKTSVLDMIKPVIQPKKVEEQSTIKEYLARKSLEPYSHVRHRLPIDDDKRPSVSLWGILKSSVGKDLTKISFPVSFNECTSMLQRMTEDMEYDACLTVAASEQDSLKRIAFVAAFAMSNYSSTIGRIAKPFNPLLSQTFEYAIPNRYRYISEQVSHHPPISSCYCEAPTWKYYGEVDAQNKFQGRSFEIRPVGTAHAELIIPKSWAREGLQYPDAGAEYGEGFVREHYTWKKVTTNISNFIMGTPIIDHYGDLVVTNHRTGETCTLTFKPRSWRGKDAMEISGRVVDSAGQTAWDIAGRWDSQLVARRAGSSSPLNADTQVKDQKEYLLLWRNSEKPKAPFNLTPFAITLNDIPSGLRPYLCPTDCRLRTDQRAFENAEYDKAQELKTANEGRQRTTRQLRAEGKLPAHEAHWFEPCTDPDSGERMWEPKRTSDGEVKFWAEREQAGQKGEWEGVDHIFVEDGDQ